MPEKLSTIFSGLHKYVLDILFPIGCISCGEEGKWICEACESRLTIQNEHVCGVCEKMTTPDGRTCINCKKKSALDGLIVAASYKQTLIARAVHTYKYRFVSDLHIQLGDLLVRALQKTEIPLADIVAPIPLHPRRLRFRGFNQSALLAKHIAANLLPHTQMIFDENMLVRKKYTPPQMGIKNYKDRLRNIKDAFSLADGKDVKNKTVLLIDDIATTGSTIFECARVLKDAGAKEVYATVIARQEMKNNRQ